ncbi:uncharacterized protein MAM_05554 [Metarhizium album ARSEF 1941]|uniref:Extracellular protein n=1 Tax=Metarhizium album (strain ARSEF 1941) TaxID=1081103 RepID=A0A0B2WKM5_METAS|nr:uncharacterized protein MAM_05554 [Metarhizium album ARSEF 1941]KHN96611.1 hypothetical protein MAM_05554 [Metarhizium album ARSEF 1941]
MKAFSVASAVLSAASFAAGHMQMKSPPSLRSSFNKFTTDVDYDMTSPLSSSGSNFPCRNSLELLGTAQGKPVEEWTAGQKQQMTITGGAPHSGGSCQASMSYDKGKTWTVIKSWQGNCPSGAGDTVSDFMLPADAPAGEALFAWSWFNKVGNREMYMNCAVITVKAGQGSESVSSTTPWSSRPEMFVANVGNGCSTVEGTDLKFPNPGPDVETSTAKSLKLGDAVGKCQKPAPGADKPTTPSPNPPSGPGAGTKLPGDENKLVLPPSTTSKVNEPPFPTLDPSSPPSNGNNTVPSAAPPTTLQTSTTPTPTPGTPAPGGDRKTCTPGAYECTPDNKGWRVCTVLKSWVLAGQCPDGTVCQVNKQNKTPYCLAKAGSFRYSSFRPAQN